MPAVRLTDARKAFILNLFSEANVWCTCMELNVCTPPAVLKGQDADLDEVRILSDLGLLSFQKHDALGFWKIEYRLSKEGRKWLTAHEDLLPLKRITPCTCPEEVYRYNRGHSLEFQFGEHHLEEGNEWYDEESDTDPSLPLPTVTATSSCSMYRPANVCPFCGGDGIGEEGTPGSCTDCRGSGVWPPPAPPKPKKQLVIRTAADVRKALSSRNISDTPAKPKPHFTIGGRK